MLCLFLDVTNGSEIKQALVEQRILNATVLNASCVSTLLNHPVACHPYNVVGEPVSRDVCSEQGVLRGRTRHNEGEDT